MPKHLSKIKNKIAFLLILLAIVLLFIFIAGFFIFNKPMYHAVYLENGEIYFGKLKYFPSPRLEDAYTIFNNPGNKEVPFAVLKISDQLLRGHEGLSDTLYINPRTIVWQTKLTLESILLRGFLNDDKKDIQQLLESPQDKNLPNQEQSTNPDEILKRIPQLSSPPGF